MGETTARLAQSHDQHDALGDLAKQHQAQDATDQIQVAKALQAQNDAIAGIAGIAGNKQGPGGQDGKFPELSEPHIVLSSPAGIESTTKGSTHHHSGQHHAITSVLHTSISAAKSLLVSAKEAIRMFAYKGSNGTGIKLVSSKESIEIQALKTSVNLLAKLDITMTANRIEIRAKKSVTLNGGGSYTTWSAAGIDSGTTGSHNAHAGHHAHPLGRSEEVVMPVLPTGVPKGNSVRSFS